MKKASLVFALLFFIGGGLFSQTKKIFHRSHSGKESRFKIILLSNLPDLEGSNFGQAPNRIVKSAKLDSVIFVSPEKAILVTSNYCQKRHEPGEEAKLWKAGREEANNHPLFSRQHALDSIKRELKNYNFQNDLNSVVFVGYDNVYPKIKNVPKTKTKTKSKDKQGKTVLKTDSSSTTKKENKTQSVFIKNDDFKTPPTSYNYLVAVLILLMAVSIYFQYKTNNQISKTC